VSINLSIAAAVVAPVPKYCYRNKKFSYSESDISRFVVCITNTVIVLVIEAEFGQLVLDRYPWRKLCSIFCAT